ILLERRGFLLTTLAPTHPSLRSEVFKPCVEDKDLAFCLNEGECSIIETVAGVHRHCRCKEGYHGLRCDQFVPKTDAILSDPSTLPILPFFLFHCVIQSGVNQQQ
uniref:EGF-like domain-containing protein n=1 Tax=Neolamprologus brichardi TaxID=32507 RepID=A0A3Q4N0X9_NEOBR